MLFKVTNDTQSLRHIWSYGRQTLVAPGESKVLEILDNNAVFLRRCEIRGDKFRIEATDDDGAKVLQRASVPPQPRTWPRGLGPDVDTSGEIRDGVEEARIRELAKQADPGMRKAAEVARVPREE
jgi:hypothetical protein